MGDFLGRKEKSWPVSLGCERSEGGEKTTAGATIWRVAATCSLFDGESQQAARLQSPRESTTAAATLVQTQSSEIIIGSSASDGGREKGNDQRQAVRLAFFVISVVFGLLPTRERRRLLHPAAARKKETERIVLMSVNADRWIERRPMIGRLHL